MRSLAQPEVIRSALIAALISALSSYPVLALWPARTLPIWYLESTLFLGGTVLWGFVFGWYTKYTLQPLFTFARSAFVEATIAGLLGGAIMGFLLDPTLQKLVPTDYPADRIHWLAATLFALGFSQLFLVFAPFSWCLRLSRNPEFALGLTVMFGVMVVAMKQFRVSQPLPGLVFFEVLVFRVMSGFFSARLFLKGGILPVCWFGLLIQSRLLFAFGLH
jgi:hypothetical protein